MTRFALVLLICAPIIVVAQGPWSVGGGVGMSIGANDAEVEQRQFFPLVRAEALLEVESGLAFHGTAGWTRNGTRDLGGFSEFRTTLFQADARVRYAPWHTERFEFYFTAGLGTVHYDVTDEPYNADSLLPRSGFAAIAPLGLGIATTFNDRWVVDAFVTANASFTDAINPVYDNVNDGYWSIGVSLRYRLGEPYVEPPPPPDLDEDGDGMRRSEEERHGTDPLKRDTDADGLDDKEEIYVTRTSPLLNDTDRDGLLDAQEVRGLRTNALVRDTDRDGLPDGDEVNTYKSNPLEVDTDGDGIADGDEVTRYGTNPILADSDKGLVPDGVEVANGTDPVNGYDDLVSRAYRLDGIVFRGPTDVLHPRSDATIASVVDMLRTNTRTSVVLTVRVPATTDAAADQLLSQRQAESLRRAISGRGIDAARVAVRGTGGAAGIKDPVVEISIAP
jgi:outer membrane protein OmpA-like peptidoglycan-associated protein